MEILPDMEDTGDMRGKHTQGANAGKKRTLVSGGFANNIIEIKYKLREMTRHETISN